MEEFLKLCLSCAFRKLTESGRVNESPAYLFAAHLVASSVGAATATIRNGHGTVADSIVHLSCVAYSADSRIFWPPIFFSKGIYVDVGNNAVSVLIQYRQTGGLNIHTETRPLRSYIPSWLGGSPRDKKSA